jgi:hypothetical protein
MRGAFAALFTQTGDLIYFGQDGAMWVLPLRRGPELEFGAPRKRLTVPPGVVSGAPTPSGERMLLAVPEQQRATTGLNVVLDWPALARQRR